MLASHATLSITEPANRITVLDGIRGFAILLVMLNHFGYEGGIIESKVLIDKIFFMISRLGWCGVDLFFVLSGFLITGILLDTKGRDFYFRNFYIRRFLRIFPLYYLFLAGFFLLLPRLASMNPELQRIANDQSSFWLYLINVKIAADGWPPYAVGHFWSLAVEEQFYLFWPIIVFMFSRRDLLFICSACMVGSFLVRVGLSFSDNPVAAYVLTPARMDTLAVGAYLALVARSPNGLASLSRWAWPVVTISSVALLAIFVWRKPISPEGDALVLTVGHTLVAVFFGALITVALKATQRHVTHKIFAHPALTFLGRYSYGIYVFHWPIALFIGRNLFGVGTIATFMGSQLPGQLLFMLVAGGFSVGLAWLSWHFYEAKFLSLKRLFPYPPEIKTIQAAPV